MCRGFWKGLAIGDVLLDAPFGRRCGGIGRLALSVFGEGFRRLVAPAVAESRSLGFSGLFVREKDVFFFLVLCFWRVSFVARGF